MLADLVKKLASGLTVDQVAVQSQEFDNGGIWYSSVQNGLVISAYYHPTKYHTATAQRVAVLFGTIRKQAKSRAGPGKWAVAVVSKGLGVGHTYYNTESK
jgi:hypothetical protein